MCSKAALNSITEAITSSVLQLFAEKLSSVILYGSYARKENDSESDIDIFLLLNMPASEIEGYNDEIAVLSSRLSLENEDCVMVSVIMQDIDTFEKYKSVLPFYSNIVSEGIVLYAV